MRETVQLTQEDKRQIQSLGMSVKDVLRQLSVFEKGPNYLDLERPCTIGDGIRLLDPARVDSLGNVYEHALTNFTAAKFIPASGASTRMFKPLFSWREKELAGNNPPIVQEAREGNYDAAFVLQFVCNLPQFAFWPLVEKKLKKQGKLFPFHWDNRVCLDMINLVLLEPGLGYGNIPKGLIPFHKYKGRSITPFEEHLVEACQYCKGANDECHLHFTVADEHLETFKQIFSKLKPKYEKQCRVRYHVDFSLQSHATDTIAVTPECKPFRTKEGSLFFRPGGHGALLNNLNNVDSDIVFINNIDNVVPNRVKGERARWKKALAGLLISVQEKTFHYLNRLNRVDWSPLIVELAADFVCDYFGMCTYFKEMEINTKRTKLLQVLNRPIRVCGMVRNQGDPGGAPFWTREKDGNLTLQIVESAQVKANSLKAVEIFRSSTHFNPVDIVCGMKDHTGAKFDLSQFVDHEAVFIADKSLHGKGLKALELPGLWNGSMSAWNSVFVEVPNAAFNPVKTVNDLLLPTHE